MLTLGGGGEGLGKNQNVLDFFHIRRLFEHICKFSSVFASFESRFHSLSKSLKLIATARTAYGWGTVELTVATSNILDFYPGQNN
jgi:hypothetical protein